MKISLSKKEEYIDISLFATKKLDGSEFNQGIIEDVAATARNNSEAIGRLLDVLAQLGFVNESDVEFVILGYNCGSLKFIRES